MPTQLSIVIPALNEAARLPATLAKLGRYCAARPERFEIILVDDGSTDNTAELLRSPPVAAANLTWRTLRNPGNRGKGFSVRHGMLDAEGDRLLFTDADLSAPITELPKLEAALNAGADIAIGSRRERKLITAHQSVFRENAGRVFNAIVRATLGLPYVDTQCGFKLFTRASALAIFPLQRIERWGFDPELLFIARRRGYKVKEVPVEWAHADGAKIRMVADSGRMFAEVIQIRGNAWRGCYPRTPRLAPATGLPGKAGVGD
ncbi:MAG TPA: dolichyl-phosphate beta-glucosyltransferase [Terriglobales bacterium]|nr:dolichyl-phosphate beta-glucosyltransferase [Terriglobales bacterium]